MSSVVVVVVRDYNDFLEDLEEDAAYRQNVNIYKGERYLVIFNFKIKSFLLKVKTTKLCSLKVRYQILSLTLQNKGASHPPSTMVC